jgi:hypothetical protein
VFFLSPRNAAILSAKRGSLFLQRGFLAVVSYLAEEGFSAAASLTSTPNLAGQRKAIPDILWERANNLEKEINKIVLTEQV